LLVEQRRQELIRLAPRVCWNSFDDVFNFQREADRLFNQFWSDLPTRTAGDPASPSPPFHVNQTEDGLRVDAPLPGIDPKDVSLELRATTSPFAPSR
jgi:HSP20 family molecular chaperone IbpA